jgi:hypothetical protein
VRPPHQAHAGAASADRPRPVSCDAVNLQLRVLQAADQGDTVALFETNLVCASGPEVRERFAVGCFDDEAVSEDIGHLADRVLGCSSWLTVCSLAERERRLGLQFEPSLASGLQHCLQAIDHLQGKVGADFHLLVIRALDIDNRVASLQAEMCGLRRRGRRRSIALGTRSAGRRRLGASEVARAGLRFTRRLGRS